jgi:uncharacterized protein YciI
VESTVSAEFKSVIETLTSKMLKKQLFVVLWKSLGHPDLVKRDLPKHLDYMIGLEKRGVIFASGPFTPGQGASLGDGLTIFRASSIDEAKVFANSDPFVLSGARGYDIREWTVMEGRVTVELDFSDTSYRIE